MVTAISSLTTGLPGLDKVLKGIIPGDNIVWQVDCIEDYIAFVKPYCLAAKKEGRKLVYFRFAGHPPLVSESDGIKIIQLEPSEGFESFIARIHEVIEEAGRGAFYIFDCLTKLAADWYSDQMLANFFMLTCPYLYDLETVAYFSLLRGYHSSRATQTITDTTQLLLDVHHFEEKIYIHPLKVQYRFSPTMNMLHMWEGDEFEPVTSSSSISSILNSMDWPGLHVDSKTGFWTKTFGEAYALFDLIKQGECPPEKEKEIEQKLIRMIFSRDDEIIPLISRYIGIKDILDIRKRMVGTGLIGGKTVGMILARAILKQANPKFHEILEPHDSFFVGSDVFYTFLVQNGIWWIRQKQRHPETFLEGAVQARQRILTGKFPDHIIKQFEKILDYFGQSAIIVRSSSLLEDNFGNSFAGKYESVFCANQGSRERRMEDFLAAIRAVYASTMSEDALVYRKRRGMLDRDEQMALLIMRVSGSMYDRYFYPQAAGVAFSFNPYVWNEEIDPRAGVLRLVFGLGTRAVNRSDDDYTRVVALNAPKKRPETNFDEVQEYAQRRVDYLDLDANQLVSGYFTDLITNHAHPDLDLFTSIDRTVKSKDNDPTHVLTFDRLLEETTFVQDMRDALKIIEEAYQYPVDIEFTLNFFKSNYKINLVQCRPLPVKGLEEVSPPPKNIKSQERIIEAHCAVIGTSRRVSIDQFIYIVPSTYANLNHQDRYEVARLIGRINRVADSKNPETIMLLGPGRWGTSTPELGVPVNFADINRVAVLCEIVAMRDDFTPDVSLGTHFLNELVEMDMLYLALFPKQRNNYMNESFFIHSPNQLTKILPDSQKWENIIKVIKGIDVTPQDKSMTLYADALTQKVLCAFC